MTQKDMSLSLRVSVVTVQCWERGTKIPSAPAIVALANLFDVSADYLLGIESGNIPVVSEEEQALLDDFRILDNHGKEAVSLLCSLEKSRVLEAAKQSVVPTRFIPLYSTPSAAGISAPLDDDDFEMIPVSETTPHGADFAVHIQGESMLPYIHDGDVVYVSRHSELKVGDVGIFSVDGAMYCKQYYIDEDKNLTLVSANPAFQHTNVFVSADSGSSVRCYGKVLLNRKIELPTYLA